MIFLFTQKKLERSENTFCNFFFIKTLQCILNKIAMWTGVGWVAAIFDTRCCRVREIVSASATPWSASRSPWWPSCATSGSSEQRTPKTIWSCSSFWREQRFHFKLSPYKLSNKPREAKKCLSEFSRTQSPIFPNIFELIEPLICLLIVISHTIIWTKPF